MNRWKIWAGFIWAFIATEIAWAQGSKDIEPFPPMAGFEAVYAQQTPFMVQGNKRGNKIHIKYNFKGSNPPAFTAILDYYLQLVEVKGGKAQKRLPAQQIFEYSENGKDIWMQVTEARLGSYELIGIEKDTPKMNALAEDIPQDVEGSKDYPLLPRLPNYYISSYAEENFFSNGQISGYKYQINYKFDIESGETPMKDEKVVQHYIAKVRSYGGKIIRNDGPTATMDFTKDQMYRWVQIGAFGNAYELIVVEKDLTGKTQYAQKSKPYEIVQPAPAEKQRIVENVPAKTEVVTTKPAEQKTPPKEKPAPVIPEKEVTVVEQQPRKKQAQPTIAEEKLSQQQTETTITAKNQPLMNQMQPIISQDLEGAKDYDVLGRFKGYVISAYKLEDFYMGYKRSGVKYQINYLWENPQLKPPVDEEVVSYYISKVKTLGGRIIRNDGATATLEFTQNNVYRWVQVGSFGRSYELVVVEKDLNRNYEQPIAQNKPYEVREDKSGITVRTATDAGATPALSQEQREILAQSRPVPVPQADITNARDYEGLPRREGYVISNYREEDFYMGYKLSGLKYQINYVWSSETSAPPTDEDVIAYYKNLIAQNKGRVIRDDGPTATLEYTQNNVYRWVQVGSFGRSYELVVVEKDLNRNYEQPIAQNKPYEVREDKSGITVRTATDAGATPALSQEQREILAQSRPVPVPQADITNARDYEGLPRREGYVISNYREEDFYMGYKLSGLKYQINYVWSSETSAPPTDEDVIAYYKNLIAQNKGRVIRDDGPTATLEYTQNNVYRWVQVGSFGRSYELVVVEKDLNRNYEQPMAQNKPYVVEKARGGDARVLTSEGVISPSAAEQISELGITPDAVAPRTYPIADVEGSTDFRLMKRLPGYLITAYNEGDYNLTPGQIGYKYQISYTWADANAAPMPDEQVVSHYVNLAKSYGGRVIRDDGPTATVEFYDGAVYYWVQVGSFGNSYELIVVEKGLTVGGKATATMAAANAETAAKRMFRSLTAQGKAVLQNILFESENSAVLTKDSDASLALIARLLTDQPTLKLIIVAHTAKGKSIEADLLLSDQRAKAIVQRLTEKFTIAANRLEARGVGSLAPIAPDTTDGRMENERVELLIY
jgi:outer membrane protein OmpA-like peptidoglycan-associated protein